jgi:hypothetical protein
MCTVLLISFVVSSTCFGCYLHPSSAAQLQQVCMVLCVIALEQVLVWDSVSLKHGQLQKCRANDERNKECSVHVVGPETYTCILPRCTEPQTSNLKT